MSEELKPCPFCGDEIEIIPAHFESNWCVNVPSIICKKCRQTYDGSDIMQIGKSEAQNEEFATNLLVKWWNNRPAENKLEKENNVLKDTVNKLCDRNRQLDIQGTLSAFDIVAQTIKKEQEIKKLTIEIADLKAKLKEVTK